MAADERLLTTAQTARRLNVKPETVYAYVSRGLLRSVRGPGRQGSRFDAREVDRLAERGHEGRTPSGVVERIRTGLTLLEDDELYYRGRRVTELAETVPIEAVAPLLWTGELGGPAVFRAPKVPAEVAATAIAALPESVRLVDRIRVGVAAAAAVDPLRYDLSPTAVVRRTEGLLALLVDALAPNGDPRGGPGGDAALSARLWPALPRAPRPAAPGELALLDTMLVALADHGLAVSTLAARVAASARAHPYAVVSAGLGAMDGPYHGVASTMAHRFLAEALTDPVGVLGERLRSHPSVPGFGHRVYRRRDPRARLLLDALRGHPSAAPVLGAVDAIVDALAGRPDAFPNVDLALAAAAHALDLRPDAGEAIFAIARTVGWVAHALEEYGHPHLRFRAEGNYTGPRPRG